MPSLLSISLDGLLLALALIAEQAEGRMRVSCTIMRSYYSMSLSDDIWLQLEIENLRSVIFLNQFDREGRPVTIHL